VDIQKISFSDAEILYSWASDPTTRKWAINQNKIEWNDHCKWIKSKIDNINCLFFIGVVNGSPVGTIRYDYDAKNAENIVSITIDPSERGNGYGAAILKATTNTPELPHPIIAFIKSENIASKKIFAKCGFAYKGKEIISEVELEKYEYQ
jgi:UDP-2,4-diacetamido-2,4,6-trideoxy-beta-L-altropyranose hydrolase